MADIIQFKPKPKKLVITEEQIFNDIVETVIDEWAEAANKNKLLQYITSFLPECEENPLYNLSVVADIERKISISTMVISPNFRDDGTHLGWSASFGYNSKIFALPIQLVSEQSARVMNAIVYVRFKAQLKSLQ